MPRLTTVAGTRYYRNVESLSRTTGSEMVDAPADASRQPKPFLRRALDGINAHPVATLGVLIASVSFFFSSQITQLTATVNNATASSNLIAASLRDQTAALREQIRAEVTAIRDQMVAQTAALRDQTTAAMTAMYSATGRIDGLTDKVANAASQLQEVQHDTSKIENIEILASRTESRLRSSDDKLQVIDDKIGKIRPFEHTIVESYGVKVDENLLVQVHRGKIVAFPLNDKKRSELAQAQFIMTNKQIFDTPAGMVHGWALPTSTDLRP